MSKFFKIFLSFIAFFIIFSNNKTAKATEKINITPLIKTSKGLGGKKISYPRWRQAELRLLKVEIPKGLRTPIHTHPAPMIVYVSQGKLKHVRGNVITYFKEGDSFVESNFGSKHFVENIGTSTVILFVGVSSAVEIPTTIND
tara:strand:+ start:135 stop:563 length:429 start_codon:yes stop_codon:yes gene_type:complete